MFSFPPPPSIAISSSNPSPDSGAFACSNQPGDIITFF
jgi:hypothetical protein